MLKVTKNRSLHICDCGLAEYREVLQLQHQLREERLEGKIQDTVLIAEHPAVITLGARQSANKLQSSREDLAQRHIDVVDIRRGGGTTAHNPGQLVFYPILHLQQLDLGISEYIRQLEAIGAELLEQLGVYSYKGLSLSDEKEILRYAANDKRGTKERKGFPGLWVGPRKIASIGVRVSRFVTYHGMAINIQNDLNIFDFIAPCGLDDIEMTSVLKETGEYYSMNRVKRRLSQLLVRHFS
ncbi:MAG: lipoyl(octanoyl) transferase LipB [Planctomycetota bacterium]|jgi:lipoate-protein ligase B